MLVWGSMIFLPSCYLILRLLHMSNYYAWIILVWVPWIGSLRFLKKKTPGTTYVVMSYLVDIGLQYLSLSLSINIAVGPKMGRIFWWSMASWWSTGWALHFKPLILGAVGIACAVGFSQYDFKYDMIIPARYSPVILRMMLRAKYKKDRTCLN